MRAIALFLVLTIVSVVGYASTQVRTSVPAATPVVQSPLTYEYTPRGYVDLHLKADQQVTEITITWEEEVGWNYLDDCLDWVGGDLTHDVPTHLEPSEDGFSVSIKTHKGRAFPVGEWSAKVKFLGGLSPKVKSVTVK